MYDFPERGYIHSPITKSETIHNKKVEAVAHELVRLEKVLGVPKYSYVDRIFGQTSTKDMIVAGILKNYDY